MSYLIDFKTLLLFLLSKKEEQGVYTLNVKETTDARKSMEENGYVISFNPYEIAYTIENLSWMFKVDSDSISLTQNGIKYFKKRREAKVYCVSSQDFESLNKFIKI